MRRMWGLLAVFLLAASAPAAANVPISKSFFPDEVFRDYVKRFDLPNKDGKRDGMLSYEEIARVSVIVIDASHRAIRSLEGIEYFTGLKQLTCTDTKLTALNLKSSNEDLTTLDVSGCTALKDLNCSKKQLISLDVSRCTALEGLWCSRNQLTALDVSGCTALKRLHCNSNALTTLVVRGTTSLYELNCGWNQLTTLDVSGCTALEKLYYENNPLTTLVVRGCTALRKLDHREKQLISLDASGCTALKGLWCSNNQLTALDVSGCRELENLFCENNQLRALDLSGCTKLESLYCSENQLTALDVSRNTRLYQLYCGNNQLRVLDVSRNTDLRFLSCSNNQLTALDVSRNTALGLFACSENQLTALDISQLVAPRQVWCGNNQLTSLDVSRTSLWYLDCENNQLTSLDVNTTLMGLWCSNNQLRALDLSGCTKLESLYCSENQLTALDVSKNTALKGLHCEKNRLTFLDLGRLGKLVPSSVDVGRQTRDGLKVSETGGTYVVDLGAFLPADRFVNVKDLAGKAGSADLTARYNFGSGKATFDAKPEKVTYRYDTGKDAYRMEVSLVEAMEPPVTPDVPVPDYRITVIPSDHGRITPQNSTGALSGDVIVSADSSVTFVVSADAGYEIAYLRDNAVSVDVPAGAARYEHTISNVGANHRLEAAFKAQSAPPVNPPAPPSGPDVPPVTPPVTPPAPPSSPDMPPVTPPVSPDVPPVTPPVSPDVPAPSPSGPVDIPSSANQWTIYWGARDAQGNVSVTVDVRIESESPLIAGSIRLEVSGIGKVRIVLLLDGQEVSSSGSYPVPARAATQKRAYTLRVMGTVAESARDTARIDAVRYKLEGSDKEEVVRLGEKGGGILLKDMTQKPGTPEPNSGGGCTAGLGSAALLALVPLALRRRR